MILFLNKQVISPLSDDELFKIRKQMVMRHVAWMTSLRHALKEHKDWEVSKLDKSDLEFMSKVKVKEWKYSFAEE